MTKLKNIMCAALLTVLVSACVAPQQRVGKQLVAEPDPISLRLTAAVDKASMALQTLAAIEQARTPAPVVSMVSNAPRELRRTFSVDWVGPIEPIAQRLADRAGYEFATLGAEPPVPVIVTVKATEKPIIDVLRDVGLQAGHIANIIVDAERKVVEVSYAPIFGS